MKRKIFPLETSLYLLKLQQLMSKVLSKASTYLTVRFPCWCYTSSDDDDISSIKNYWVFSYAKILYRLNGSECSSDFWNRNNQWNHRPQRACSHREWYPKKCYALNWDLRTTRDVWWPDQWIPDLPMVILKEKMREMHDQKHKINYQCIK